MSESKNEWAFRLSAIGDLEISLNGGESWWPHGATNTHRYVFDAEIFRRLSEHAEQAATIERLERELEKTINERDGHFSKCEELGKALKIVKAERDNHRAWFPGEPPKYIRDEWFIAKTTHGDKVVLQALPEDWSHDYRTADGTYMMSDAIKEWMQFPDSGYKPHLQTELEAMTADRDRLAAELADTRTTAEYIKAEADGLRTALQEANENRAKMIDALTDARADRDRLQSELDALRKPKPEPLMLAGAGAEVTHSGHTGNGHSTYEVRDRLYRRETLIFAAQIHGMTDDEVSEFAKRLDALREGA